MKYRARSGDLRKRSSPTLLVTAELNNLDKATRSGKLTRRVVKIVMEYFLVIGACFGLPLLFLYRFT